MTGSLAGALAGNLTHAAAVTTLPAVGVQRLAWLLLAFPTAGSVILLLGGKRTNAWGHLLGVTMSLASFVYGVVLFVQMLGRPGDQRAMDDHVYSWVPGIGRFHVPIGVQIDQLSICFVLLITGVGSLILIYAVGYMAKDPERRRFFGYLNLFIAAMLLLVIADNYVALYAGWEGVGLASYLLIGFWYYNPAPPVAAKKAFIANRVGDLGMSLAIMPMFAAFGSVTFTGVFGQVGQAGQGVTTALGLLLLL
ncbi:MAG TPA: proton-conducting transporter membrane subunit, partial [Streptosporangiaceae bacterium]|nr:proton-conducting transporter membrane subunit [Streptosporangiaceae bacterium]